MNQSFLFLALQIINIIAGLFSTVYIAANVEPHFYSLVIVYQIIITFYGCFTSLGYETVLIRNALKWQNGYEKRLMYFVSMSLVIRVVVFFILMLPVLIYSFYIAQNNYQGEYLSVILLFSLSGLFYSFNNWLSLVLKSFNNYIAGFTILTLGSLATKTVGVWLFVQFGFEYFVLVLVIMPALIFICSVWIVSKYLRPINFSVKRFIFAKRFLSFGAMGYLKYALSQSDRVVVSILLSPEVQAAYGLAKQFQDIGKSFVEGFFDPLIQKVVQYRNDINKSNAHIKFVAKVNALIVLLGSVVLTALVVYIDDIIMLLGFTKYNHIETYLIFVLFSSFTYLLYKTPANLISLFAKPKLLVFVDIIGWLIGIISITVISNSLLLEYLYLNRLLTELFMLFTFTYLWLKGRNTYLHMRTI
jgi:O-antigen/teichoic acid export membrane protein